MYYTVLYKKLLIATILLITIQHDTISGQETRHTEFTPAQLIELQKIIKRNEQEYTIEQNANTQNNRETPQSNIPDDESNAENWLFKDFARH